jgi:putative OPT family oligopeptide transporter
MALLQKPAQSPEEVELGRPLDISPAEVAEFDEETWYARAYRGDDVPQLTLRAILMGSFLGFLLAFTNLYIGLKTGWHLGVAITACILSYTIWQGMLRVGVAKTPMSILENNCMQSTASAAGYSTGGTMVSAIAALLMLSATPENPAGEHLPIWVLAAWTFLLAVLGVTLAIPMKRNMINQDRLKFPSGLAAAATLQSLYASGAEATRKAKSLLWSAAFGAIFPILIDLKTTKDGGLVPGSVNIFDGWLPVGGRHRDTGEPYQASDWTMTWDMNPVMIAAGMIVGLRVTFWMLFSALALVFIAGPMAFDAAWVNPAGETVYAVSKGTKAWKEIGLWLGAPIMVSSGLLSFAFQWRTIVRAFQGFMGSSSEDGNDHADVEVPMSWFAVGAGVSGIGIVLLANLFFEIPLHFGVLAVVLTFFLALVAARATGESDITPTGAMGKLMQLTYGVLIPQSATANLMTAGITAGAAGATADLLNDLKSGYLLGANPRRQFIAQAAGIFSGTIATVAGFLLLVPDATALNGTDEAAPAFPAPAAQAWRAVAEVFRDGIGSMHPMHQQAIVIGLIFGAILVSLEHFSPKERRSMLPSATGIGLGLILPFQYPLSMFVGAVITAGWQRQNAQSAEDYIVPVASGVIAGVSIVGVLVALVNTVL